jgi:hypothetical protein
MEIARAQGAVMTKRADRQLLWLAGMALLHQRREVPWFWLHLPGLLWFLFICGYGVYLLVTGRPVRKYAGYSMFRRNRPRNTHYALPPPPVRTNWLRVAGALMIITYFVYTCVDNPDYSLPIFLLILICLLVFIIGHIVAYRSRNVL